LLALRGIRLNVRLGSVYQSSIYVTVLPIARMSTMKIKACALPQRDHPSKRRRHS
ncbi:hypothetical protein GCK32_019245, partial [Trichostrongylus colubriformis]